MKSSSPWVVLLALCAAVAAHADAVWQWSAPVDSVTPPNSTAPPRAFLWIPPAAPQVRAVVVGQNKMIEEGILQHVSNTASSGGKWPAWASRRYSCHRDIHCAHL